MSALPFYEKVWSPQFVQRGEISMAAVYQNPNTDGALVNFKERYDNFIGGK